MTASAARRSFLSASPPAVAVEVAADRVSVVSIDHGSNPTVTAYAVEHLPAGAIIPSLNAKNILDTNGASEALGRAMERSALRSGRVALVVPDAVARVSLVPFESVPERPGELEQLIRWQVRKSVPFPIDDAQVSWQRGAGNEFIVSVARRDIVEEYEALASRLALEPGIVDLATFNQINAVLASGSIEGDWMLVHLTPHDASIGVVRGEHLIFFRNKATAADEPVEDLVHQTAMYHEDRLGGGAFSRIVVSGLSSFPGSDVRRSLEARLGASIETIDPRGAAALRDRIAAAPELLDSLAAPLGVLMREVAA
jgi:Tfp pilus assembly PilM family ATPase